MRYPEASLFADEVTNKLDSEFEFYRENVIGLSDEELERDQHALERLFNTVKRWRNRAEAEERRRYWKQRAFGIVRDPEGVTPILSVHPPQQRWRDHELELEPFFSKRFADPKWN